MSAQEEGEQPQSPLRQQRPHPKRWNAGSAREDRRRDALRRQREARRELTERVRNLVLESMYKEDEGEEEQQHQEQGQERQHTAAMEEADVDEGVSLDSSQQQQQQQQRQRRRRQRQRRPPAFQRAAYFASQFAIPEWLVDVPPDLNGTGKDGEAAGWVVMARPEGRRCLLAASGGITVSRLTNGAVLHRFESALPNGGPNSPGPANGSTLLDCIYHEPNRTYYLLDLLCWRSMELMDCTAEFRLFFLRSKYEENLEPRGAGFCADAGAPDPWRYRMRPLLYSACDPVGLRRAYEGFTPFVRDGLLFLHTQAYYDMGLSPLSLLWKDARSSRVMAAAISGAQPLSCVLSVRRSGDAGREGEYELATLEGLVVEHASAVQVEGAWGLFAAPDSAQGKEEEEIDMRLARFWYEAAREEPQAPAPHHEAHGAVPPASALVVVVVEGLRFQKSCSSDRAVADPWSRILFHDRARGGGGVAFEDLLRAAEGVEVGEDGDGSSMLS